MYCTWYEDDKEKCTKKKVFRNIFSRLILSQLRLGYAFKKDRKETQDGYQDNCPRLNPQ